MRGRRGSLVTILAAIVSVALIAASCAPNASPSPLPTATPVATPTEVPSTSAPISRAAGGSVEVPGGPTLAIGAGGVTSDTTATIRASSDAVPGEADSWPAMPIGPAWDIDLGGQSLAEPATLTFHFDPAALPPGLSAHGLLIAYLDSTTNAWHPVPVTVDPTGTATAKITHLSTWGFFGFDLSRWLIVLKALASAQITDLTTALSGLLTTCSTTGGGFTIDNSLANNMVEGCFPDKPTQGKASVSVTNLRAFALSLSSPRGYVDLQLLAPGDSVQFSVPNTDVPPATVSATMTADGLWWSVTDIVMRMLPGWTELKASPDYATIVAFAAAGTKAVWDSSGISEDVAARKYTQAAESTVTLLTGDDYLEALTAALQRAAAKYGLPWLGVVDAPMLHQILTVVNLADLIVTTWSFVGDYFFNAQTTVTVNWEQTLPPSKPAAPTGVHAFDLGNYVEPCPGYIWCETWRITWHDASNNETGFRIYFAEPGRGSPILVGRVGKNATRFNYDFQGGTSEAPCFWVAAFNSVGASKMVPASDSCAYGL